MKDVAVIGGGLAGLISAISLRKAGYEVILFERKKFPFHKVCGEYLSREVAEFLASLNLDLFSLGAIPIDELHLTASGKTEVFTRLEMGGLSVSRYALDNYIFNQAQLLGVVCCDDTEITGVRFQNDKFEISDDVGNTFESRTCIGSFGKASGLDKELDRKLPKPVSGYIGVKCHYSGEYPLNRVGLHNFQGGYCGISNIEERKVNVCYLVNSRYIRELSGIPEFEKQVLRKNKFINDFLGSAKPEFEKPIAISQIFFGKREIVNHHILFCGDAAGTIAPLTGNGMAMAVHSAKIASEHIDAFLNEKITRPEMEKSYTEAWNRNFLRRINLSMGLQTLFGKNIVSSLSLNILKRLPSLMPMLIRQTHGQSI